MSQMCKELELKFIGLEAKVEAKSTIVNDIYKDEIKLLEKKFDINSLIEKYSNGWIIESSITKYGFGNKPG